MSETVETEGERLPGEEELRNIVEWTEEGPGQGNFLRIIADSLSSEIIDLLRLHGYSIVQFDDLSTPAQRANFEGLLVESQSYMNRLKAGKIAVIISKQGKDQVMQDGSLRGNWSLNTQYMETFYL